jgi:heat shock protein HtpX
VYEQIARNKRRAVVYLVLFFAVWAGVGALLGAIAGNVIGGAVLFAGLAGIGIVYTMTVGTRTVLAVSGARPADPQQYLQLHNIVEALAIGDGLPKPDVYVIDDPSPNAFATGTSPNRAAITATTGLLEMMNREELEGVIGHEMSHIKNYDVRLILIVSTLIGMAGLLASLLWRMAYFTGDSDDDDAAKLGLVIIVAAVLLSIVGFVVGPLIRMALSRRRESLADVSSVELTRNPVGLIDALKKLQENNQPMKKFNHATAAMLIDDPLGYHRRWYHDLFETHPPIEDRIAVLEEIASGRSV